MSVHADALAVLAAWTAPNAWQDRLRYEYLAHLREQPDGVWRHCVPAHLTAGGIVVDPQRTATLLVLHARIGQWVQPGGHFESSDRCLVDAVRREVGEETGLGGFEVASAPLVLSRHQAPCASGTRWHLDVQYTVTAAGDATPTLSAESRDVAWFAADALPDDLASGVAASVAAAL